MTQRTGNLKKLGGISCVVMALSISTFALSACDLTRNHLKMDRSGNMDMQDYRDALAPRIAEEDAKDALQGGANDVPELEAYVANPSQDLKPMPLVSISVNQTVPLRDALFELATQADYDIELDPRIRGSIIFTARNKPFDLVIDRISSIAGLRYKIEDEIVRVELDTPYIKTYKIDYLSYIRQNTSSIKNDVSVVSGEGANTGSKFEAAGKSEADFWGELQVNLTQMLGVSQAKSSMMTANDPTIVAATSNAPPVEPIVTQGPDGEQVVVQPPSATLEVQSLPTEALSAPETTAQLAPGESPDGSSFALNKQAGIVSVNATERQHRQIGDYLKQLHRSVTSQVLIEAKIMEVSLNDEFSAGVNWELLEGLIGEFNMGFIGVSGGSVRPPLPNAVLGDGNFSLGYAGNDVTAVVDAVSRFGAVKALASPRLTVLNNQSAVLNVANNEVYFEVDIDVTTEEGVTQTDVSSQIRNVPEGVLINVQPSINLDDQTISMSVRPTITRIISRTPDPAVAYISAGLTEPIESLIPVVNIQEMDSVVKVGSGQALLMGGLMQDRTDATQNGVPVLGEIPFFGAAFRNQVDQVRKTELVIFLRATIIHDGGIDDTDKDLYKRFSGDRRPLKL